LWQQQVAKATAAANENKEKFVFFIKLNRCGFIFFLLLSPPSSTSSLASGFRFHFWLCFCFNFWLRGVFLGCVTASYSGTLTKYFYQARNENA